MRQASVKLMRSMSNCTEGQLLFDFESRPRTGSYMFSLRLGAIYLRDKITTDSLFPLLPHQALKMPHCSSYSCVPAPKRIVVELDLVLETPVVVFYRKEASLRDSCGSYWPDLCKQSSTGRVAGSG